jgi:hypothetical protein
MVLIGCLWCVLGMAWAQERATGGGISCWVSDSKQWGWSLHALHNAPTHYLQLDWGYRNLSTPQPIGVIRGEAGLPLAKWETGTLGFGPSVTWYWAARDSMNLEGWLRAVSDDDREENYLESLFEAALAVAFYSTVDAASSPLTSINDHGNGIKIRPALTLQQSLGSVGQFRVTHDFGHGGNDPFSGTGYSLALVKRF